MLKSFSSLAVVTGSSSFAICCPGMVKQQWFTLKHPGKLTGAIQQVGAASAYKLFVSGTPTAAEQCSTVAPRTGSVQTLPHGLVEASTVDRRSKVKIVRRSKVKIVSIAIGAAALVEGLVPVIGATSLAVGATSPAMPLVIAATSLANGASQSADHVVVVISKNFKELARTIKTASKQTARTSPTDKTPERRGEESYAHHLRKSLECIMLSESSNVSAVAPAAVFSWSRNYGRP
jgi:hypothetical protein